jgi:hypothetical protein
MKTRISDLEQINQVQYSQIETLLIRIKDLYQKVEHLEKLLKHEAIILNFPTNKTHPKE